MALLSIMDPYQQPSRARVINRYDQSAVVPIPNVSHACWPQVLKVVENQRTSAGGAKKLKSSLPPRAASKSATTTPLQWILC